MSARKRKSHQLANAVVKLFLAPMFPSRLQRVCEILGSNTHSGTSRAASVSHTHLQGENKTGLVLHHWKWVAICIIDAVHGFEVHDVGAIDKATVKV